MAQIKNTTQNKSNILKTLLRDNIVIWSAVSIASLSTLVYLDVKRDLNAEFLRIESCKSAIVRNDEKEIVRNITGMMDHSFTYDAEKYSALSGNKNAIALVTSRLKENDELTRAAAFGYPPNKQ